MVTAAEIQARVETAKAVSELAGRESVSDPFTNKLMRLVAAELISGDDAVRMLDAAEKLAEIQSAA